MAANTASNSQDGATSSAAPLPDLFILANNLRTYGARWYITQRDRSNMTDARAAAQAALPAHLRTTLNQELDEIINIEAFDRGKFVEEMEKIPSGREAYAYVGAKAAQLFRRLTDESLLKTALKKSFLEFVPPGVPAPPGSAATPGASQPSQASQSQTTGRAPAAASPKSVKRPAPAPASPGRSSTSATGRASAAQSASKGASQGAKTASRPETPTAATNPLAQPTRFNTNQLSNEMIDPALFNATPTPTATGSQQEGPANKRQKTNNTAQFYKKARAAPFVIMDKVSGSGSSSIQAPSALHRADSIPREFLSTAPSLKHASPSPGVSMQAGKQTVASQATAGRLASMPGAAHDGVPVSAERAAPLLNLATETSTPHDERWAGAIDRKDVLSASREPSEQPRDTFSRFFEEREEGGSFGQVRPSQAAGQSSADARQQQASQARQTTSFLQQESTRSVTPQTQTNGDHRASNGTYCSQCSERLQTLQATTRQTQASLEETQKHAGKLQGELDKLQDRLVGILCAQQVKHDSAMALLEEKLTRTFQLHLEQLEERNTQSLKQAEKRAQLHAEQLCKSTEEAFKRGIESRFTALQKRLQHQEEAVKSYSRMAAGSVPSFGTSSVYANGNRSDRGTPTGLDAIDPTALIAARVNEAVNELKSLMLEKLEQRVEIVQTELVRRVHKAEGTLRKLCLNLCEPIKPEPDTTTELVPVKDKVTVLDDATTMQVTALAAESKQCQKHIQTLIASNGVLNRVLDDHARTFKTVSELLDNYKETTSGLRRFMSRLCKTLGLTPTDCGEIRDEPPFEVSLLEDMAKRVKTLEGALKEAEDYFPLAIRARVLAKEIDR